jgi:hypothetical protein
MSIEPDVPLNITDEVADASWRDPNMTLYLDGPRPSTVVHGNLDGQWYLPAGSAGAIFGEYNHKLKEIPSSTECMLEYNKAQHCIDIWGSERMVNKTKKALTIYCESYEERIQSKVIKRKKWPRNERAPTAVEEERKEKKDEKMAYARSFQGKPLLPQLYSAIFFILNANIPINLLLSDKNSLIHRISFECKSHIWYDPISSSVQVSGPEESDVAEAASRVRNHYLKVLRQILPKSKLVMQKPKKGGRVKFTKKPSNLIMNKYHPQIMSVILKSIDMDIVLHQPYDNKENLIDMFTECNVNEKIPSVPFSLQTLDDVNKSKLREMLNVCLESVRLQKGKITMKICFGHLLYQTDKIRQHYSSSFERFHAKLPELHSNDTELTTCITTSATSFDSLLQYFSSDTTGPLQINGTQYLIEGEHHSLTETGIKKNTDVPPTMTIVSVDFKEDGTINFWDYVYDQGKHVADFKCINLENNCDFAIQMAYSPQLPTDENSVHGKFINKLTLGPENRLYISCIPFGIVPRLIIQRITWHTNWRGYTVELARDESWSVHKITRVKAETVIDLSLHKPCRISYSVSIYKEAWTNRFAENTSLSLGEAPKWKPKDFICSMDENPGKYLEDAAMFSHLLDRIIIAPWNK